MPGAIEKPAKLPTFAEIQSALRGRKLDSLGAIADKLDVPLWVMFVPGLTKEFFAEKRQLHRLVHVVQQYIAGDGEPEKGALDDARDGVRQALAVIEVARSACVDDDLDAYNMLGGLRRILESAEADMVKAGAST